MDPLPTSFIPRRPMMSESVPVYQRSHSGGLLGVLSVVSVVATIVAFGGVYLYGANLEKQKSALQETITSAKDGLGTDFVSDMKRLNNRIEGVKTLIKGHVVLSPIFEALQATTLRSVQYDTFGYSFITDPITKTQVVEVKITGSAKNYATIALQSDAFTQNKLIKNPLFANLTIDENTARVGFNLTFTVPVSSLSYQEIIAAKQAPAAAPTVSTTPPVGVPPIPVPLGAPTTPAVPSTDTTAPVAAPQIPGGATKPPTPPTTTAPKPAAAPVAPTVPTGAPLPPPMPPTNTTAL